ncbi:MAG: hypothetical protein ACP5D2_00100 [Candidatus Nanoarchaeia archaeon]
MEKWQESLIQARKHIKVAEHMNYLLNLLKERQLIMKMLLEVSIASKELIKAFLYYEYLWKRVRLYKDAKMNLKTFKEKIASKYLTEQELSIILKILELSKKHELAGLEFVRNDKFVILLGDKYETITSDLVKQYLTIIKQAINKFPA